MRGLSLLLLLAGGCGLLGGNNSNGNVNGNNNGNNSADTKQYEALQQQLDGNRSQILDNDAGEVDPEGGYAYYQTFENFAPQLHRRDDVSGQTLDYTFSIGAGDDANDRANGSIVVTAEQTGDSVIYHCYDATQANKLLGDVSFPAPNDAKWWSYAVDGSTVYVVTNEDGTSNDLYRFTAGDTTATMLTTIESATGTQIGEWDDFAVDGGTMIFIESGRIWSLDLGSNHATWLMNMTQVSTGASFNRDGVLFSTDDNKLMLFTYADHSLRTISDEIAASPYKINDTYSTSHYFSEDYTRWGSWVIYGSSNDGIYGYNLDTHAVAPVLLPPISDNLRIVYRYPQALDDGSLYVVGLTSTDGAVGADGPVYKVPLATALK